MEHVYMYTLISDVYNRWTRMNEKFYMYNQSTEALKWNEMRKIKVMFL